MTYAREQDLKYSTEQQFCSFFYAFEIKEGTQGRYKKVAESKAGIELQDS